MMQAVPLISQRLQAPPIALASPPKSATPRQLAVPVAPVGVKGSRVSPVRRSGGAALPGMQPVVRSPQRSPPKRSPLTGAANSPSAPPAQPVSVKSSPTKAKPKEEVAPEAVPLGKRQYKYIVLKGNNSNLVREALMRRPWWTPTAEHDTQFNFKWKQTCHELHYNLLNRDSSTKQMVNHFEYNRELTTKPGLLRNLMAYMERKDMNVFDVLPVTFFIRPGGLPHENEMQEFTAFFNMIAARNAQQKDRELAAAKKKSAIAEGESENGPPSEATEGSGMEKRAQVKVSTKTPQTKTPVASVSRRRKATQRTIPQKQCEHNVWILKPSGMNRGRGITLIDNPKVLMQYIEEKDSPSWVVQKYLERPLLIHNRKFDIRVYCLLVYPYDVYFYKEGYLRTSSSGFTLANISDHSVHLTNNAVQKDAADYGKYEEGNQLSFEQFQEHLDQHHASAKMNFQRDMIPRIKEMILTSALSVRKVLNPQDRKRCFELFGYDFMIDEDFKLWLIEVNTNPCLALSSSILRRILPQMIEDVLCLTVDEEFPGHTREKRKPEMFELLYSERQGDKPAAAS